MPSSSDIKGRGCITANAPALCLGRSFSSGEAAEEEQPHPTAAFSASLPSPVESRKSVVAPSWRSRRSDALLRGWPIGSRWLCRYPAGDVRHHCLSSGRTVGRREILFVYPAAFSRCGIHDLDPAVLSADHLQCSARWPSCVPEWDVGVGKVLLRC
jgi:hypothetical protein